MLLSGSILAQASQAFKVNATQSKMSWRHQLHTELGFHLSLPGEGGRSKNGEGTSKKEKLAKREKNKLTKYVLTGHILGASGIFLSHTYMQTLLLCFHTGRQTDRQAKTGATSQYMLKYAKNVVWV